MLPDKIKFPSNIATSNLIYKSISVAKLIHAAGLHSSAFKPVEKYILNIIFENMKFHRQHGWGDLVTV